MSKEKWSIKDKLFNLREWLTMSEAAQHLSIIFGEEVFEADIFRLALDGHLVLSVNFVNATYGQCGILISCDDTENFPPHILSKYAEIPEEKKELWLSVYSQLNYYPDYFIDFYDDVTDIEGVWDLSMVSNQPYHIEHEYQKLTGGPEVKSPFIGATFVLRGDNEVCRLYERFEDSEEELYYEPAVRLPSNSVFVVRTRALIDLQENIFSEEHAKDGNQIAAPFLDRNHRFHAEELDIAIEAWTELYEINPPRHVPQGGHKKYITKWLAESHPSLSQRARDRITTIINPNPKGGASPTE